MTSAPVRGDGDAERPNRALRLLIYLMHQDVQEFTDALKRDESTGALAYQSMLTLPLAGAPDVDGEFYYLEPTRRTPAWVGFVRPLVNDSLDSVESASNSALLLLRTSDRIFALTFGYGRSLLDLSKIEYQFGLRVALNRIDPSQLRSLDTKTFQDMVVSTSTQVSQATELPTFGVDISTDILRGVTGKPRDTTVTSQMSGADALVMNVKLLARELPGLCADLLDAFGEQHYKTDFGWIDQLSLVRRPQLIAQLNDQLVQELVSGQTAATHMAMPEVISWEDIDSFTIDGAPGQEYDDLDLNAYLADLGAARSRITLSRLESRRVGVRYGRTGDVDRLWSLHKCLVSEQRVDGLLHVLIEGRWFEVADSLVTEVDQFTAALPPATAALIPAKAGEHEAVYNERLAKSSPGHLLKLDAQIKRPGGAASGIELCDVLSDRGELIHVKRKSRSATLSHLFSQGSVSATTFLRDGTYRDQIRAHIEETLPANEQSRWLSLVPPSGSTVSQGRYTVTYAVVANSTKPGADWLPFFSKLNLMQHGRLLGGMGFGVALDRIPVQ